MKIPRIALITNIPAPYREGTHLELYNLLGNNYHVYYCAKTEPNRAWKFDIGNYEYTYLKDTKIKLGKKQVYFNFDIYSKLNKSNPDVVITGGFNPTMLIAFIWSVLHKKKRIYYSDGTLKSEEHLSKVHRIIRSFIFRYTHAFIAASKKGSELYESYGIKKEKIFFSPYCINNEEYYEFIKSKKEFDILFTGQLIQRKLPFFIIEVIKRVNSTYKCSIAIAGSGELKEKIIEELDNSELNYKYLNFIQPENIPEIYSKCKIMLFPTQYDAWGLVANEACALGLPVITCDNAGAANELVINDFNGFVLPLDTKIWAEHIIKLLTNKEQYDIFSENAIKSVENFNYKNSADGIIDAARFTLIKKN